MVMEYEIERNTGLRVRNGMGIQTGLMKTYITFEISQNTVIRGMKDAIQRRWIWFLMRYIVIAHI